MVKQLVYKAHIKYMEICDQIEVKRQLVTFTDDPELL